MKTKFALILSVIGILASCKQTPKEAELITFPIDKAVQIEDDSLLQNVRQISLQTSVASMIGGMPEIICTDNSIFVFDAQQAKNVLRFDNSGKFICKIGKEGSGPQEYFSPTSFIIDQTNKNVEILAFGGISVYDFNGGFVKKMTDSIPATSFAKDQQNNYWFSTGNNYHYSKNKVHKTGNNQHLEFIPSTNLLPTQENNFSNFSSSDITYHESFSYDLYKVDDKGNLAQTLKVDFGNFNILDIGKDVDMFTYFDALQKKDFITIRLYFDNADYQYIYTIINSKSRDVTRTFHWIIDKHSKKQYVLGIKTNKRDWFLITPHMLTNNNELVLSGYTQSEINNQDEYAAKNVSVFFVPLTSIIQYCEKNK